MSLKTTGVVELRFASGSPITAWETFTLRDNYTDPLGSFTFTVAPPKAKRDDYRNRLAKGEQVSIAIDGAVQTTALITTVEQSVDTNGWALSLGAKSLLVTPYEGSVDPYISESFQTDSPVADVILSVLGDYGFDMVVTDTTASVEAITGKSLVGRAPIVTLSDLKHQDVKANHGQTAYAFCARILSRLGVVLRVNQDGVLLVGAPDYDQNAAYTLTQGVTGGDQVHGKITARDTNDGQFSETQVFGKRADQRGTTTGSTPVSRITALWPWSDRPTTTAAGGGGGSTTAVASTHRPADAPYDDVASVLMPVGRHSYSGPWKPRYVLDKRSRDADRAGSIAELIHGATARRAYSVRCTVDGLISMSGKAIWTVDTVAGVQFADLAIDEDMWILETTKTASRTGGQQTALTLIPLNSLVLGG